MTSDAKLISIADQIVARYRDAEGTTEDKLALIAKEYEEQYGFDSVEAVVAQGSTKKK